MFFGVEETKEEEQKARWLDRRKRLASRKYGSLREEYMAPAPRPPPFRTSAPVTPITPVPAPRQPQLKSAYATQVRVFNFPIDFLLLRSSTLGTLGLSIVESLNFRINFQNFMNLILVF